MIDERLKSKKQINAVEFILTIMVFDTTPSHENPCRSLDGALRCEVCVLDVS